jgi:hypothetical protein
MLFVMLSNTKQYVVHIYLNIYAQHINISENLNDTIDFYLYEDERIKFYEFQNAKIR